MIIVSYEILNVLTIDDDVNFKSDMISNDADVNATEVSATTAVNAVLIQFLDREDLSTKCDSIADV